MIEIDVTLTRSSSFTLTARFSAPGRGVTALFGRSGAGKSTIIHMVAGTVRPDSGIIRVGDAVFFDSASRTELPMERRRVGYVFQDARLFPHMGVENNLRYGERRAGAERRIGFDAVVGMLGIGHLLKRRPHTLSGGERQRVAIGRALLAQPRLLLMDEPLAALDDQRKAEILPYLERLRDELKLPILYVSHSLEEVLRLSDMAVAMADGQVVAAGPVAEVMSRPELLPVIGRFDLGTILDCTVKAHDPAYALSTLAFQDGELRVPLVDLPVGTPARARVRSRDVALSLSRPMDVSVTNRLAGKVSDIRREEGPYADVGVDLGHATLRALVTKESVERLALEPGMPAWVMIKAVAVDARSPLFDTPAPGEAPAADLPAAVSPPSAPALRLVGTDRPSRGNG
ncbi:molybdenum ABC transporter ATP-binding protein [Azorhizobium doebereinerae]|uniref:molybdenum ABC transporter ATP-binding protein n=1 Tax=Azorhizobium doebereinerae TaxID=281091 RepID=UPI000411DDE5|nr:molybdenum ABC transporter ATP-binding protein [Azorhizobium doebereinerae]